MKMVEAFVGSKSRISYCLPGREVIAQFGIPGACDDKGQVQFRWSQVRFCSLVHDNFHCFFSTVDREVLKLKISRDERKGVRAPGIDEDRNKSKNHATTFGLVNPR